MAEARAEGNEPATLAAPTELSNRSKVENTRPAKSCNGIFKAQKDDAVFKLIEEPAAK